MTIKAVIFDLNGTILTDEDEYGLAFKTILGKLGAKNIEDYPQESGVGVEENWPILLKKYNLKTKRTMGELASETQMEYLKLLPQVTLRRGFLDLVKIFKSTGTKIALATSNTWEMVEKIFEKFSIEDLFDTVTTKEELTHNKPDPEIFELTANKLNTSESDCLVFEDSQAGIRAGHEAGMRVVGVARNEAHRKVLKDADVVIEDYSKLIL